MSGSGSLTYLPYVLDAATCAIGSLLIYSGVKGTFVDPLAWAKGFGLPTATPENVVLFPSATGRNLGAGFFVWTMIILRERMVLGIFLMCWSWAGIADTKVLYAHPKGTNQAMHIRNTVIVLILGPLLIQSSQT
ncbi:uncharacterized protein N7469_000596 [Penicillium citrinum]|uniref:Uncharacterized protein n=2 Tax=Penicillium TaxID=5073 RepID=A0A9W9PD22_PENCI|nr:uncharacterized protein N7469_000596 [Penicillium citrinum]KAJ5242269.1 hypothetical protein N7469_000596 [Penicillium citrinum]KAJ5600241.1 hypothetical protein N7450_001308 [Penicillium hetheringtonii]